MGQLCWKTNTIEDGLLAIECELHAISTRKAEAREDLKALQVAQGSLLHRASRANASGDVRAQLLVNQTDQLKLERRIQRFDRETSGLRDQRDQLMDSEHILQKTKRMQIVERSMGQVAGKMRVDLAQSTMDDIKDHHEVLQEMSEVYEEAGTNSSQFEAPRSSRILRRVFCQRRPGWRAKGCRWWVCDGACTALRVTRVCSVRATARRDHRDTSATSRQHS